MKAWNVHQKYGDATAIVFAETAGKAKTTALATENFWGSDFLDVEVHRQPGADQFYTPGKTEMDWCDPQDRICRDAPGYIVHHKVWLTPENITDPDIALNPANFLYVCHDCHNKIENDGGNLYYFDENGQPQPADKANASGATPP